MPISSIIVKPIPALRDNYIWCIINPSNQQCAIVDPGVAEPVIQYLEANQLKLSAILITHHHQDHTGGIAALAPYCQRVYGPANENILGVTHRVKEGNEINLPQLETKFEVLDIPGHTSGHVAYYTPGMVFCGDTLFTAGCGRLFEGTATQLWQSLQKLANLPNDTLVYCGHEYTAANLKFALAVDSDNPTLIERISNTAELRANHQPTVPAQLSLEKQTNPFLRVTEAAIISAVNQYFKESNTDKITVFARLRTWKDHFS